MIELKTLLRQFGYELEDVIRRTDEAMVPYETERREVVRKLEALRVNRKAFQRAVAVRLGKMQPDILDRDPMARFYHEVLEDEDVRGAEGDAVPLGGGPGCVQVLGSRLGDETEERPHE